MGKQIIVPVDGSSHCLRALDIAVDLAKQRGLGILLLHVVPSGGVSQGLREWAEIEHVHEMPQWLYPEGVANNLLQSARDHIAADAGIELEQEVAYGDPAKCIIAMSMTERAAMVVIGSRGLSDAAGLVFGSVAHRVAHAASCPVITVT